MLRYQSAVAINRPPEEVFPYLVEPKKQALWSDVPMRSLTEGPLGKGSRIEVNFGRGPLKATVGLELTALEPNRRMSWTTFSGPIGWQGDYVLEPAGEGGTKLSQDGSLTFHGLWRLLEPLVGAEIRSGEVKELERLKAVAEASPG
jgi:uncharacterized protein YndB with AHSA1/START domain